MQVTIYEYSIKDGKLKKTVYTAFKRTTSHGVVYIFKRGTAHQYAHEKQFKQILNNRIFTVVEDDEKYRKMMQSHYEEKVRATEKKLQQYKEILEKLEE